MKCRECGREFQAAVLSKEDCERLAKAADLIHASFSWENSIDGWEYWTKIEEKLRKASQRGYI